MILKIIILDILLKLSCIHRILKFMKIFLKPRNSKILSQTHTHIKQLSVTILCPTTLLSTTHTRKPPIPNFSENSIPTYTHAALIFPKPLGAYTHGCRVPGLDGHLTDLMNFSLSRCCNARAREAAVFRAAAREPGRLAAFPAGCI